MLELKPCPFCGSPVEIIVIQTGVGLRSAIRCKSLDCYLAYPGGFTAWHTDESEKQVEERLAKAWNKRVSQTEVNQYGENCTNITNCGTLNLTL